MIEARPSLNNPRAYNNVSPAASHEGKYIHDCLISKLNENPLNRLPSTSYWYDNFGNVFPIFEEAAMCYDNGTYEACAVMCRNAIDSFLYVATNRRIIRNYEVDDEEADVHEMIRDTFNLKDPAVSKELETDKKAYYKFVRKIIEKNDVLSSSELDKINDQVREKGNFSAHLAEMQDKYSSKWHKMHHKELEEMFVTKTREIDLEFLENFGPKTWTLKEEALELLKITSFYLEKIIIGYYKSAKNIDQTVGNPVF